MARIDAYLHALDVVRVEGVAPAELVDGLDGGVGQVAGCVVLEADVLSVSVAIHGPGEPVLAGAAGLGGHEALLHLEDVPSAVEAPLRQSG